MTAPDYTPLWYWVCERERIRERKAAGVAPPWTADPILATYRFCNVRREDDRVTIWIRRNIRERFADHPHLWFMLCIARQINWPPTLTHLIASGAWPGTDNFDPCPSITRELNAWQARGEKVYTGAYMISAPSTKGADKQSYIAETVLGDLWRRRADFAAAFRDVPTLQRIHALITQSNGWGQFMAYQAIVDMRFTSLLQDASDIESWAAAGPGTLRGLNRLHGRPVDYSFSQSRALTEIRDIYQVVRAQTGVPMDFSDVPNILCETDKYLRVKLCEGKPRARYVPAKRRGSAQGALW